MFTASARRFIATTCYSTTKIRSFRGASAAVPNRWYNNHDHHQKQQPTSTAALSTSSSTSRPFTFFQQQQQQQHSIRSFTTNATSKATSMFCRQCEQTADHYACTALGVCGKTSETAACQDTLMQVIKNVSEVCVYMRENNMNEDNCDLLQTANVWTLSATFSTLTNVNFSDEGIAVFIRQGEDLRQQMLTEIQQKGLAVSGKLQSHAVLANKTVEEYEEYGIREASIPARMSLMNHNDAFALHELATYGLKGLCAYNMHCHQLGKLDADICKNIHELFALLNDLTFTNVDDCLTQLVLRVGSLNAKVLETLDQAHADAFGDPEPSPVRTTAVEGKCILVSGHDLKDLQALLEQTAGTGIQVYTHGEMMPAHGYPKLHDYSHLAGNYGTAWQNQKFEFAGFPGPIVVTTNCIMPPRKLYKDRLWTMNEVALENEDDQNHHVVNRDFSKVIEQALKCKGFPRTIEPPQFVTTGFNHRAILKPEFKNKIVKAIQSGALNRIFLIGGCDGSQWDRSYFTDLAEESTDNAAGSGGESLIMTMGCAKNRLIHSNKLENQQVLNGDLPRVLDMGQCNDSYSAMMVALELAKTIKEESPNADLPFSITWSHLEQKAIACLLTMFALGFKNIRLGPSMPAYLTPNALLLLQSKFNLMPTKDPKKDLKKMRIGQ